MALTRTPENEGENQDTSLETFPHSAWLAILTCSFSGVFVCSLWFRLSVRVNVVSCWVTLKPGKYFFLVKLHSSIYIINSLLAANCMCI